ncbi:hypothetical protein KKH39_01890 [Patescibacteria group bacterium]|nr:hypothetical protein [Patescibacteria group bacterium]
MINDRDVYGYKVSGQADAKDGIDYLDLKIDREEARVFFEQARIKGSAQFEDDKGKNYTLIKNSDGRYTVEKRASSGGGWF